MTRRVEGDLASESRLRGDDFKSVKKSQTRISRVVDRLIPELIVSGELGFTTCCEQEK
jgi:hypothetical protein